MAVKRSINNTVGVVLLNLGGPADLESIRPFLRQMFSDPAILRIPNPLRALLAWTIARFRAPLVADRYKLIGGGSPILQETRRQAQALEGALRPEGLPVRCILRYSPPFAPDVLEELSSLGVQNVIALPLFPQRSHTTTDSSLADLRRAAVKRSIQVIPVSEYPDLPGFVSVLADRIQRELDEERATILFTAHGLPELYLKDGDPYVDQVKITVKRIVDELPDPPDHLISFQSRLGPVKWVGPDVRDTVARLGKEGMRSLIVCPVSFVSEHLETIYDLDIDLPRIARAAGIVNYRRVKTVRDENRFIRGLAQLVRDRLPELGH